MSHRKIPASYQFGRLFDVLRSPKRFVYAVVLAPFALLGPLFGSGDEMVVIARKR